jgi:hypothetical protein
MRDEEQRTARETQDMAHARIEAGDAVDIVHLYAQTEWHSPAAISGSRSGLVRLRDALDSAIAGGTGCAGIMTDDGEGYAIVVMCEGPQSMGDWNGDPTDRGLPYSDELAASPPKRSFWDRVHAVARAAR